MPEKLRRGSSATRTSVRLSLQFAFLYSFLTAIVFVGAYWLTDFEVRDWMRGRMTSDADRFVSIYEQNGPDALIESMAAQVEINSNNERVAQLSDLNGVFLAGNTLTIPPSLDDEFVKVDDILPEPVDPEITGYWIIRRQVGPFMLTLGTADHVVAEVMEALSAALIGGFVLVIGLGLFSGLWIGRLTERQIERISNTLEKVADGDMSARIEDSEGVSDELARVATSINATLNRLQDLMESQQQISTDIAHDMRTPLQHLRQRLEEIEANDSPRSEDIAAALRETDEIISTFNALLRIAQIGASDQRERFAVVDLGEVAETVFDAFEPIAADNHQTLNLSVASGPSTVWGDKNLLMQLAVNLVENGLRHCPTGSHVSIGVSASTNETSLWVSDDGPGIPSSDTDKVFRRFYRGEKSRTSPGHGLGLSLVQAIANLHQASISVRDNQPGLRVVAKFAASAATEDDKPTQEDANFGRL